MKNLMLRNQYEMRASADFKMKNQLIFQTDKLGAVVMGWEKKKKNLKKNSIASSNRLISCRRRRRVLFFGILIGVPEICSQREKALMNQLRIRRRGEGGSFWRENKRNKKKTENFKMRYVCILWQDKQQVLDLRLRAQRSKPNSLSSLSEIKLKLLLHISTVDDELRLTSL